MTRRYKDVDDGDDHVAVYLRMHNTEGKSYQIKYRFAIIDREGCMINAVGEQRSISKEGESCGKHNFAGRRELERRQHILLPLGTLSILVEVSTPPTQNSFGRKSKVESDLYTRKYF